jgi:sarcosine oxidase subunit beta
MGLSAAWQLRRADPRVRVTLLERAAPGAAASGASAAGVRAMGRDPAERALALASLARWPDLARELEGETGYRRGGGLRVALDETAWRPVPAWVAAQRADGVPVEVVDATGARQLAPGLSVACLGGVHCAIDGQADAMATVRAFAAAARRAGVRIAEGTEAVALVTEAGRVVAVATADGGRVACDVAIVAAGAWSTPLLEGAGVVLPLQTRALQMLLTEPAPAALAPVVGAFDRKLSLKQLDSGAYLIGGGWPARIAGEPASGWALLDDSVQASLATAGDVYPPVAACALARGWAGLEAFAPDGLPALGPVPGPDGLLVATGFSGHGFALAPVVGDILARLALGHDPRPDFWSGLRPDRLVATAPAGRWTVANNAARRQG